MVTTSHSLMPFLGVIGAVSVALTLGSGLADAEPLPPAPPLSPEEPCVPGVWVYNPYVQNCNLPKRGTRVLGQAPDAGALIACRGNKQCLSLYVNGGYGWYPGATLTPSYHP